MDRAAVLDLLRKKAVELLDLEPEQIQEDVSFKTDLNVDSLALVEYTMALEDDLGISLPEEEVAGLTSVGSFVDLIVTKTEAAA
jgi:acyl carrier protein